MKTLKNFQSIILNLSFCESSRVNLYLLNSENLLHSTYLDFFDRALTISPSERIRGFFFI